MKLIKSHRDLQQCRNPGFCYLCGLPLDKGAKINRDHVPPSTVFKPQDQAAPLILLTHESCNSAQSDYDEQIGQLVSLLHGTALAPKDVNKLKIAFHQIPGLPQPRVSIEGLNFRTIVFRWIKGFHAALYREYLPSVGGNFFAPLSSSNRITELDPITADQLLFIETLKRNRAAGTTDRIEIRNGACRFECFWSFDDSGKMPMCIWALDVYGWHGLGEVGVPSRSCVGYYMPARIPVTAAFDLRSEISFTNNHPLDAFAG